MNFPRLALAWPTYGRPEAIQEHLDSVLSEAGRLDIPIYISDDSLDSATHAVVRGAESRYARLYYRHNKPSLGHDQNLIATLTWPDTDYVWLLSDKLRPRPGFLTKVLEKLTNQDFLFVDTYNRDQRQIPHLADDKARKFIRDKLWHQTHTGATIYGRAPRALAQDIKIYRNFPQLSVILHHADKADTSLGWAGGHCVDYAASKQYSSYWSEKALDVFVDDWSAAVTSFPSAIPPSERFRVIRSHSKEMQLFSGSTLLKMRKSGQLRWSTLRRAHFVSAVHTPLWKIVLILLLPFSVLDAIYSRYCRLMRAYQA